jgi:hypothetical protein
MSIFKELKIRIKYRDEMKLWEDELREGINFRVKQAFFDGRINMSTFSKAYDESFPILLGREVVEIKARVENKKQ